MTINEREFTIEAISTHGDKVALSLRRTIPTTRTDPTPGGDHLDLVIPREVLRVIERSR